LTSPTASAHRAAYEHDEVVVDGHPRAYTLRVTHVYRSEKGQWRIVHRHADFPPDPDAPLFVKSK
jgi:ketosteroid isomerase-like protein